MSVFTHHNRTADRSANDRSRHKQKIEKAIREGIHDIVAEESIIGQDGKKKIRIPVRGIKEYKFVYGSNQQKAGSGGEHDIHRGQDLGKKKKKGQKPGNKPGNKPGEEFYEVEVTLEELAEYLFKDLDLPDLEQKKLKEILSKKFKRHGYRNSGIRPRLSKKETVKRKLRRKKVSERLDDGTDDESFGFIEDDLRYKHIKVKNKHATSAVIFFIMDVSGSMSKEKKYLARSFFFLLYHFIRSRYEKTELVFIAHDTQAYEVDEDKFFNRGSSGGTLVSPALEYTLDAIEKRFNPASWNVYTFHCSDGDNWQSDMDRAFECSERLKDICQFYGYCEINPSNEIINWVNDTTLSKSYAFLEDSKFKIAHIASKEDVWDAFKIFFGGVK